MRREWQPNVQYQGLFSDALQRKIYVHVTTDALKRIDRAGGLDMYLLTQPVASHGSIVAEQLRGLISAVRSPPPAACVHSSPIFDRRRSCCGGAGLGIRRPDPNIAEQSRTEQNRAEQTGPQCSPEGAPTLRVWH